MKETILSIAIAVILIGGAIYFTKGNSNSTTDATRNTTPINNVTIVDGKQIIEIKAKGGYTPLKSIAQAGIPTILRFDTNGTFDCSASVRIPSMNISKVLPNSGSTDIDLGSPIANLLQGTCGMGMYPFEIDFKA